MKENIIYNMDCLEGLKSLPDNCVDCCITSPPYFGLRDYGVAGQIGLEETPEGAILLVIKNENGTFSPLGINPDQGRIITAFIGKLSEEQPLVVAKGIELITK